MFHICSKKLMCWCLIGHDTGHPSSQSRIGEDDEGGDENSHLKIRKIRQGSEKRK
jgi:hypothetical protein